mgnify:CR=1 FL=1
MPASLTARTAKVYSTLFNNDVMRKPLALPDTRTDRPASRPSTRDGRMMYSWIGAPPSSSGLAHVTSASRCPGVARTASGRPGRAVALAYAHTKPHTSKEETQWKPCIHQRTTCCAHQ